jgi:hypothetical protein
MSYSSLNKVNSFILSLILFFCSLTVFAQDQQMVFVQGSPIGAIGKAVQIDIAYNTSNQDSTTTGLGLRIHFNSRHLHLSETIYILDKDLIVDVTGPFNDADDHDNDPETDQYYSVGWASLYGSWPDDELPVKILSLEFAVSPDIVTLVTSTTPINFSDTASAAGYQFTAENYDLELHYKTWDFDGNCKADALSDGLLFMRYAFGLRGDDLIAGVIDPSNSISTDQINVKIERALDILDIDLDGEIGALTDGLLLLRYLFEITNDQLINDVISPAAARTSTDQIVQHLDDHMPMPACGIPPSPVPTDAADSVLSLFSDAYTDQDAHTRVFRVGAS